MMMACADHPVRIAVKMRIRGDGVEVDFSDSDPQVQGSVNAVYAITASAVFLCVSDPGGRTDSLERRRYASDSADRT